ncbi:MAG: type I-C CRISPR-associated endonuclease Cas1c [Capsulimonadaceae bacterium]|nr:type I-C CRISPR-associated endonuclease Cas1c [Capsulimonadaceae bacterium]
MNLQLLNTLYVLTPDAYVRLDHDTLRVEAGGEKLMHVPAQHLGAVYLFGNAMMSAGAMQRCAEEGRAVVFFDYAGRFKARVVGPLCGNVLLRQAQHEARNDPAAALKIASAIVAGKCQNAHRSLLRGARDTKDMERAERLRTAAGKMATFIEGLPERKSIDEARGVEGQCAALYFDVFGDLINAPTDEFAFKTRSRRPPRDRMNAMLSFFYALLSADCTAACEGVGLDPQFGYLHEIRPGRPALALDLMEEFRPILSERLAVTLVNRKQIKPEHFDVRDDLGGGVLLNADGRKIVLSAYQKRKQEEVSHAFLGTKIQLGLAPHVQARILARHLRGDIDDYVPFIL